MRGERDPEQGKGKKPSLIIVSSDCFVLSSHGFLSEISYTRLKSRTRNGEKKLS